MNNVVFIPNIDLGNGRANSYHYSVKSWKNWCDKHDCEFVEWTEPIMDVKQFPIIYQREWVFDILEHNGVDYNQVAIVDSDTIINPNTPTVNMQITGGSQILPTPTNLGFYGVNPLTGFSELLPQMVKGNEMYNPMFKSGVGGFTDVLPYQFDFGIPAVNANVPIFNVGANLVDAEETKAIADAEAEANSTPAPNYIGTYLE